MMLPAYGGQESDCITRASHTFPQGMTGPLSNTQHRDGQGFDIDTTAWGMGLRNLRERVESLGGMLQIESTPGDGTTVRATFPA